ncbi:MAG: coenzyme F420-0:L-glutamate ligase [Candidatus Bathyarchaeota archaeon]|nr:MAG: coenzyme F420-0:L-glutamate ligase [Candidatus Bathyarchaeota archaeon]
MKNAKTINIIGLVGFPSVKSGDDLAELINRTAQEQGVPIEDRDILVVAQKIISKAEGRVFQLRNVNPSEKARKLAKITLKNPNFVELVLQASRRIVKISSETFIVEDNNGIICINAGIDKSNIEGDDSYALLPSNIDDSARRIRQKIMEATGKNVAVIISDTYSRPFRKGQVEYAIGIAGINPFRDYRGKEDLYNYVLKVKNIAIVDEIAAAAELVMGQGSEGIPVAIVKSFDRAELAEKCAIKDLFISKQEDLFKGTL